MIIVRDYSRELVRHSVFDSGEPELDQWLKQHAGQSERRHGTRTMLAADESEVRVAGYYASVTFRLAPDDVGASLGRPRRYPVSAVLLARLAVDRDYQGSGIGKLLLFDALMRFERASHDIGFELVVVDALHEHAASFYRKYGFQPFLDHPLKLFMTTGDLQASFASLG